MAETELARLYPAKMRAPDWWLAFEECERVRLPEDLGALRWQLWRESGKDTAEETMRLALGKHMRERGGLLPGQRLAVTALARTSLDLPCVVQVWDLVVSG